MKAQIMWSDETPTAQEVAGQISEILGKPVLARTMSFDHYHRNHYLEVEEVDFQKAVVLCSRMLDAIKNLFNINICRKIDGIDMDGQACIQYRRRDRLEKAVAEAIEKLKATRSWFKDKRIAEIRRDLEKVLAHPVE